MYSRLEQHRDFMSQHLSVRIGDGTSFFWTTHWMYLGTLLQYNSDPTYPDLTLSQAFVRGSWQLQFFARDLPDAVLKVVLSLHLSFVPSPDRNIWSLTSTGEFSVATAYSTLRHKQSPKSQLGFVWKPEIPLKHSLLMWRLLNGLLPFADIIQSFGFHQPSKCPFCNNFDSLHHCFVDCWTAYRLWAYFFHLFQLSASPSSDLWDILDFCWLDQHGHLQHVLRLLPLAICWVLWTARNSKLFDDKDSTFQGLRCQVLQLLQSYTLLQPIKVHGDAWNKLSIFPFLHLLRLHRSLLIVRWLPPVGLKLNIDGSFLSASGSTGGGMILRDAHGHILFAESVYFGHGSSLSAEILAMYHGLQLCRDRGYERVEVETDCSLLVQFLHRPSLWPWKYFSYLFQIMQLVPLVTSKVSHVYREANSVADFLAKTASSSCTSTSYTMSTLPQRAKGLCRLDIMQLPNFRYLTRKPP